MTQALLASLIPGLIAANRRPAAKDAPKGATISTRETLIQHFKDHPFESFCATQLAAIYGKTVQHMCVALTRLKQQGYIQQQPMPLKPAYYHLRITK